MIHIFCLLQPGQFIRILHRSTTCDDHSHLLIAVVVLILLHAFGNGLQDRLLDHLFVHGGGHCSLTSSGLEAKGSVVGAGDVGVEDVEAERLEGLQHRHQHPRPAPLHGHVDPESPSPAAFVAA
jgi:hypothetical protein